MAAVLAVLWLLGAVGAAADPSEALHSPIVLDPASGCSCKQLDTSVVMCFDLVSCVLFPSNVTVPRAPMARGAAGGEGATLVATLWVKNTRIPVLAAGALAGLTYLTDLSLDNNGALSLVEPHAFQGMRHVVNLSISYNPGLSHLDADALVGLDSLRRLTMVRNAFTVLGDDVTPALRRAVLPDLRVLVLDQNDLGEVAADDFLPMDGAPLQELSLGGCGLATVHRDWLAPLRRLAILSLADNNVNLAALADSLEHLPRGPLRILDLGAVGLGIGLHAAGQQAASTAPTSTTQSADVDTDLTAASTEYTTFPADLTTTTEAAARADEHLQLLRAIARSSVEDLVLRHNKVGRLWPFLLPRMPRLRRLDLSNVELTEGLAGALAADVLPGLQALNLSFNRMRTLQPGFVSDELLTLDVSHSLAAYFDMGESSFRGMHRLRELYLSYNRMLRLTNRSFVGLDGLQVLALRNASIYRLDDGVFAALRRLERLDLEHNEWPKYDGLRADMFQGLGHLRVLLLASCGVRSLGPDVFRHLTSLEQLDLRDNVLATLEGTRAFHPLRALRILDVSRNRVGSWNGARLFDHNEALQEVHAAGNTLTYFSEAMLLDLGGLRVLDLADNTFHCGCDTFRPASALRNKDMALLANKCLSPDRWRDHSLAEYVRWASLHADACAPATAPGTLLVVMLPVLLVLLLVLTGVVTLAYRYRHHLLLHWATKARKASGGVDNYQYDAFVSYSSEDQVFVHKLVSVLEGGPEPRLRLCVYERDFAVGAAITEEVLTAVAHSRRVLLVVSEAFARSHWCAWETHIAHHQRLQAEDTLLVVVLGAVDRSLLTPTLRFLMQTRIYLEWPRGPQRDEDRLQRAFWAKLRAALAPSHASPGRGGEVTLTSLDKG